MSYIKNDKSVVQFAVLMIRRLRVFEDFLLEKWGRGEKRRRGIDTWVGTQVWFGQGGKKKLPVLGNDLVISGSIGKGKGRGGANVWFFPKFSPSPTWTEWYQEEDGLVAPQIGYNWWFFVESYLKVFLASSIWVIYQEKKRLLLLQYKLNKVDEFLRIMRCWSWQ